mmetsp:Transcript_18772/g.28879  ORF Transcript_18772/g.28879 Transcript_18772/m.28879 type:complete len:100 (+) Transcript_18772:2026-2325(+)
MADVIKAQSNQVPTQSSAGQFKTMPESRPRGPQRSKPRSSKPPVPLTQKQERDSPNKTMNQAAEGSPGRHYVQESQQQTSSLLPSFPEEFQMRDSLLQA